LEVSNWLTPESGDPAFPHMAAEVGDSILFNWPGMCACVAVGIGGKPRTRWCLVSTM
jgi:hypothetical protein